MTTSIKAEVCFSGAFKGVTTMPRRNAQLRFVQMDLDQLSGPLDR